MTWLHAFLVFVFVVAVLAFFYAITDDHGSH